MPLIYVFRSSMMIIFDQADDSHLRFCFSLPSLSLRISWQKILTSFYVFVCFLKQCCAWCFISWPCHSLSIYEKDNLLASSLPW